MAKHVDQGAPVHDGRFGVAFDDEISSRGVLVTIAGVGITMAVAFVLMWFFYLYLDGARERPDMAPTPRMMAEAKKMAVPSLSPRLQADPEGELVTMRREQAKRLHGYGWVDEGNKVVHIPVEQAMALVLERGLNAAGQTVVAPSAGDVTAEPSGLDASGSDHAEPATDTDHATADPAETEPADGAHSS